MNSKDHSIICNYMKELYEGRITGDSLPELIIGEENLNEVMVGMISANRIQQDIRTPGKVTENKETRFESVPAIGFDTNITCASSGTIAVYPKGYMFYRIKPTYEETVQYYIKKFCKSENRIFLGIEEIENYFVQKDEMPDLRFPAFYKKVDFSVLFSRPILVELSECNGIRSLSKEIEERLNRTVEQIQEESIFLPELPLNFRCLKHKRDFELCFPEHFMIKNRITPTWNFDILITSVVANGVRKLSFRMHNRSEEADVSLRNTFKSVIYNANLRVVLGADIKVCEQSLKVCQKTYKNIERIWAVAVNTSVRYLPETNEFITNHIPMYVQKRLKTRTELERYLTFDALLENPVQNLNTVADKMEQDYQRLNQKYRIAKKRGDLDPQYYELYEEDLGNYKRELKRFRNGIQQIQLKDFVFRAFRYMNRTFALQLNPKTKKFVGWRVFQIVFLVSLINDVIKTEYLEDPDLALVDLDIADLLYFPTGGGKTEAFLGTVIFTIFFDRLRGKKSGLTAYLKYPLRLLTVQQLERVLTMIMKAEEVRKQELREKFGEPFCVGFFVGSKNTPNAISKERAQELMQFPQEELDKQYRMIEKCPACGSSVHVIFRSNTWRLVHCCENPACLQTELPLFLVDHEIYRYVPTVIVATLDKLTAVSMNSNFRCLFGQARYCCPKHGLTAGRWCMEKTAAQCMEPLQPAPLVYDPVPTLMIQDELHLVKESLGTFAAHYESFLKFFAQEGVRPKDQKKIKYIGATATISRYEEQINHLYHMNGRKFPCTYPDTEPGNDFYSFTDPEEIARIMIGYAPYGRSIINGVWESVVVLRKITYELIEHAEQNISILWKRGFTGTLEEFRKQLYDYWIILCYNNRKDDVFQLNSAFQNQANNELRQYHVPEFVTDTVSGDSTFQSIRQSLFQIEANRGKLSATNLILSTSTISHGIDEDSFNLMYFFGMPPNTAEYVQAYSRVGRAGTGFVIDIIRLLRERDRSYLKNFEVFHKNKDYLVEAVPINRWAKNAIHNSLPGIILAMLFQYYGAALEKEFYYAWQLQSALTDGSIKIEEFIQKIIRCYECQLSEKPSLVYQDVIQKDVKQLLETIRDGNIDRKERLLEAVSRYSRTHLRPMTSLRDTEETITISI